MQADVSVYDLLRDGEETKLSSGYLHTDIGALALSGNARTLRLAVSHPVIRSFDENLSVAASVDGIDSTNALLGNLLASVRCSASATMAELGTGRGP